MMSIGKVLTVSYCLDFFLFCPWRMERLVWDEERKYRWNDYSSHSWPF